MEQTIFFNNQPYIVLDTINLGTSKYIFIFNNSTKDFRCLKVDSLEEYSIDSSFLPCDLNKKNIIEQFINQVNTFMAGEQYINPIYLKRSIKKFQFYIDESELKHYVIDDVPYQINNNNLDNLNLFLSRTIEIKDPHELFIKTEPTNDLALSFDNKVFLSFYRLNINQFVYNFTYEQQKTEFRVFIEKMENNVLTYQIPSMDLNSIEVPLYVINSNILVNYFVNRLNERVLNSNNIDMECVVNSIERFTFYLKTSEIRIKISTNAESLTTEDIIKLFLYFDEAIELEKFIETPIVTENLGPEVTYDVNPSQNINNELVTNISNEPTNYTDSNEIVNEEINDSVTIEPISSGNELTYFQKEKRKKKFNTYTLILIASVIITGVGIYMLVNWIFEGAKSNKINDNIKDEVEIEPSDGGESVNPPDESVGEAVLSDYWRYMKMSLINVDFNDLLKTNPDTVGWIQVNGTNINYPIVQSGDNDYYLHHAFDGSYNNAGWVFADYRNDLSNLSKNTVIYGHGRLDTTMFGSLKNILNSDWYNDSDNHVVKLSTPTQNTLWQVFSVYSIKAESYYITTDFPTTNQYEKFLTTLKDRSVFSFSATVNTNDKILTLSTCQDNYDNRVVMHAKLIKVENR